MIHNTIIRNNKQNKVNEKYMRLALELARKGRPSPNPYVGCVIVKDNIVIAEGYHHRCGEAHAEIDAICSYVNDTKSQIKSTKFSLRKRLNKVTEVISKKIKINKSEKIRQLKGSTFYVNLEPCIHHGRTPPCVDKIISLKPAKVVIAMLDPNPIVKGNGVKKLREAGIDVLLGVLKDDAEELNKSYIKYISTKIPYTILKSAVTMNWKITWGDGRNKKITGKESKLFSHQLRNKVDAILVGINTVLRDDPLLTTRLDFDENTDKICNNNDHCNKSRDPLRIILDSKLKIPLSAKVLKDNNIIIFTGKTNKIPSRKKILLRKRGVRVFVCRDDKISLKKVLWVLGRMGISSVLIEGGATINTSAIKEKVVDEIYFLVAPFVINKKNMKCVFSGNMDKLHFKKISVNKLGEDFIINAVPKK
ncbi:MAG: bifunctional diaminohydroxyphosphoribosylaminopyrimidine deaminase/5-amino-6-(5-phosphoribosylamino)uracil reductase RibD [Candidatus Woesearchaeota archaeon]